MLNAQQENERSLAGLLGLGEEEAAEKLNARVAVLASGEHEEAFARDLKDLLGLTLQVVDPGAAHDLEIRVGAKNHGCVEGLIVSCDGASLEVAWSPAVTKACWSPLHGLTRKIAACFCAGHVIANIVGGHILERTKDRFAFPLINLGIDDAVLSARIELHDAVMVGAGGVANGFLWALRELDVHGQLTIADPKAVRSGNLNRCFYYTVADLNKSKALMLAQHAAFDGLQLEGYLGTFQDLVGERGSPRLAITTPDSRRARRLAQDQLPLAVVDASTTDVSGVVIHSHKQRTESACLGCIYSFIRAEGDREHDIASGLGVSVADVQTGLIDQTIAQKIAAAHPDLQVEDIIGISLESLYKEKCGEGALLTSAGEQALAPFAFISALAGALQALELARFVQGVGQGSNYMNLDPWSPPHARVRRLKGRLPACHFCSRPEALASLRLVWGSELEG
jgi:hypothetical protein